MSQSLSKMYIHIVFHVKNNQIHVLQKDKPHLYAYIGKVIKDLQCIPICINGTGDHIHILCVMSKNIALAKLVEEIKRHSSRWLKTIDKHYTNFAWQGGYAGFSVSPSVHDITKRYIENQEEHHRKKSIQEELLLFLKKYRVDYDDKYLWTD